MLGSQLDCQSFDLDLAGVFQLAGNDVSLTIVDGPSAALDMAGDHAGDVFDGVAGASQRVPLSTAA
ncbi:MAG: hypothetical protein ACK58X_08380 [Planctomycetota bacterium]